MTEKVAIILVNYNGGEDTIRCVESILNSDGDHLIIIVENGSSDNSLSLLSGWIEDKADWSILDSNDISDNKSISSNSHVMITSDVNRGFAGGNNIGLKYALNHDDIEYFWLLNNDTEIEKQAVTALVQRFKDRPEIGICGSRLMWYAFPDKVQAHAGARYFAEHGRSENITHFTSVEAIEEEMDMIVGASMMVSRDFLNQVGFMSEEYFLYFEELDWALRSKGKFVLGYAHDSVVYHKEGASIGSSSKNRPSDLSLKYIMKNRLKFTKKFFPEQLSNIRKRLLFEILVYTKRRDWKAVKIIVSAMFFDLVSKTS